MTSEELSPLAAAARIEVTRRTVLKVAAALGISSGFYFEVVGATPALGAEYVQYQFPFPTSAITQNFNAGHGATDFGYGVFRGYPIPAVADGYVSAKNFGGAMGYRIEIKHADDVYSGYCHMDVASTLNVGDAVARGSTIGFVGNSGVTDYHLHLAMSLVPGSAIAGSSGYSNCFDPIPYIADRLGAPPPKRKSVSTLYLKASTYSATGTSPNLLFALAGESPGNAANWIESNVMSLAVAWSQTHGVWVYLTDSNWTAFRDYYLQPLKTTAV